MCATYSVQLNDILYFCNSIHSLYKCIVPHKYGLTVRLDFADFVGLIAVYVLVQLNGANLRRFSRCGRLCRIFRESAFKVIRAIFFSSSLFLPLLPPISHARMQFNGPKSERKLGNWAQNDADSQDRHHLGKSLLSHSIQQTLVSHSLNLSKRFQTDSDDPLYFQYYKVDLFSFKTRNHGSQGSIKWFLSRQTELKPIVVRKSEKDPVPDLVCIISEPKWMVQSVLLFILMNQTSVTRQHRALKSFFNEFCLVVPGPFLENCCV